MTPENYELDNLIKENLWLRYQLNCEYEWLPLNKRIKEIKESNRRLEDKLQDRINERLGGPSGN